MPDVEAVRVSPARAVPLMVGAPVAGLFAACCCCCCEARPVMVAPCAAGEDPVSGSAGSALHRAASPPRQDHHDIFVRAGLDGHLPFLGLPVQPVGGGDRSPGHLQQVVLAEPCVDPYRLAELYIECEAVPAVMGGRHIGELGGQRLQQCRVRLVRD